MKTPADINRALTTALDKHVDGYKSIHYVNWSNYANSGDHLIAYGAFRYLTSRGVEITSVTANHKSQGFHGQPIIAQGGGNIGDLHTVHEEFRLRLISKNHASPIVILPQSIYFKDLASIRQSARIYNAHHNLTLFIREQTSYDKAKVIFKDCNVVLCPDMAWYLFDWVAGLMKNRTNTQGMMTRDRSEKSWYELAHHEAIHIKEPKILISQAVSLGAVLQLSNCQVLNTERMHGHILACMMSIPSYLYENPTPGLVGVCNHKSRSTYETWTKDLNDTYLVNEPRWSNR